MLTQIKQKHYNMATYKLNYYKITSKVQKGLTHLTFNECRHEAKIKSAEIEFSSDNGSLTINNLTLGDLKKLRKVVRKQIRKLQYGKI